MSRSPRAVSPSEELRNLRLKDLHRDIHRSYREIQEEIQTIGDKLTATLKRQEEEYLMAFKAQIGKVNEEVRSMRTEMERQMEVYNLDTQLQRLMQTSKELDGEANRLAARVQSSQQQAVHWKLRSQELHSETLHLARQNQFLRRRIRAIQPDNTLKPSGEFSPVQTTSTKASNTPYRSNDSEDRGYVTSAVSQLANKYAISDPEFVTDMEEIAYLLQRPLRTTIRHLQLTLENTQKQLKRLVQEQVKASELQSTFQTCLQEAKKQTDKSIALELLCESEHLQTEISRLLSPRRSPALSVLRASVTPRDKVEVPILDSDVLSPHRSQTKTPNRRRVGPVVVRGKLMLATRLGW